MRDLDFLLEVPDEELEFLADIIRDKGGLTNELKRRSDYSTREAYVDAIQRELLNYGSNTIGFQKDYREVLNDVCDKMKVSYTDSQSIKNIEANLLGEVSNQLWEKASAEGRRALVEAMDKNATILPQASASVFAAIFRAGGFASYQLSLILVNSLAKFVLGRGLTLAGNMMFTRLLSFVSGPLGILMGIWTAKDILGPAYRVTVPAVICVAGFRQLIDNKKFLPAEQSL